MTESVISKSSNLFLNKHPLVIRITSGPYAGQDVAISSEKCLIRGQFQNQAQCAIYRGTHHTILQDIAGNTCLNGNPVHESRLHEGDTIQCGELSLCVETLKHQEKHIHFRPEANSEPASQSTTVSLDDSENSNPSSTQAASMLAKLDGIQKDLKQLDESTRTDEASSPRPLPKTESKTTTSPEKLATPSDSDQSFQKEMNRMYNDLVGQIGKCRRDLVRLTQDVKSHSQSVSEISEKSDFQSDTFEEVREHSAKLNRLTQSLNQLRSETTEQIESRLEQFDPQWRQEFCDWKSQSDLHQSELNSRLSEMRCQFDAMSQQNQNHSEQLESLNVPEDRSDDIRALQQQAEFSLEQNTQILERVDRLTDSMEQMSELLKRQVSRNVDFEQKLSNIESTIADLDQSFDARIEQKTSERLEHAEQNISNRFENAEQKTSERFEDVEQRMNTFSSENQQVADRISTCENEMDRQRLSQEEAAGFAETAQQKMHELFEKMNELETCQQDLHQQNQSKRWEEQADKLATMEEALNQWRSENGEKLESLNDRGLQFQQSLNQLKTWQDEVQGELRNWGSRTEQLNVSLEELQSDLAQHRDSLASTISDSDQWRTKWQDRQTESESCQQKWAEQTGLIADSLERLRFNWEQKNQEWTDRARAYEDSVEGMRHSIEFTKSETERWQQSSHDLDQSIKQLNEKSEEHWLQLESLQQAVQTHERMIERLQSIETVTPESIIDLQHELRELKTQMDSLPNWSERFEQIESEQESTQQKLSSCENRLDSIDQACDSNRTQLESIQSEWIESRDELRDELSQNRDDLKSWQANSASKEEFDRVQEFCQSIESKLSEKMNRLTDSHSPEQFQAFQSSLTEYKNEVDQLKSESPEEERWQQLEERLDSFQTKLNSWQQETSDKFETQYEANQNLAERIAGLDQNTAEKFDRMDTYRQDFEKWSQEQEQKSNRIDESLEDMNSSFHDFQTRLDRFNERLDSMEMQKTESADADSAQVAEDLEQRLIDLQKETVGGIRSDLDETSREFESAREKFLSFNESYECRQKDLDEKLADVHLRLDEQSQWTELKQQFESLQNRFDSLEDKLENSQQPPATTDSQSQEEMGAIEERLAATIERVEQFENMKLQINNLEQAFSDWKTEPSAQSPCQPELEIQPGIQIDESKMPVLPISTSPAISDNESEEKAELLDSSVEQNQAGDKPSTATANSTDDESIEELPDSNASIQFEQLLQQLRESEGVSSADSGNDSVEHHSTSTEGENLNSEPAEASADAQLNSQDESNPEPYNEGQIRAQELENIYEQAVDSVQPTREPEITGLNMQAWAQSLAANEQADPENQESTDADEAAEALSNDDAQPSEPAEPTEAQTGSEADSKLEDILSRLSSNDGWSGVIKEDVEPESEINESFADATVSDVIVEGNADNIEVEVVDAPAAEESVADVLSRMQMDQSRQETSAEDVDKDESSSEPESLESGSLLQSMMADESSDAPSQEASMPTEMPTQMPAEMPANESAGSSDVSVQEYMSQLFGRLRGDEDEPIEELREPEHKAALPKPVEEAPVVPAVPVSDETAPLSPAEYVPQHQAPTTNIDALRKLANETTREAVSISVKKKTRSMKSLYLGLAVGSAIVGSMMFFTSKSGFNMMSLLSLGLIGAAAYCGFKYIKSNGADDFADSKSNQKKTANPPAPEQAPVQVESPQATLPQPIETPAVAEGDSPETK